MADYLVKVHPQAKSDRVEMIDETHLKVWVTEQAVRGKANGAAVRLLAQYLDVPEACVIVLTGEKNHTKRIRVVAYD